MKCMKNFGAYLLGALAMAAPWVVYMIKGAMGVIEAIIILGACQIAWLISIEKITRGLWDENLELKKKIKELGR